MRSLIRRFLGDTEYSKGEWGLRVADRVPIANPIYSLGYQKEIYVNIFKCKTDLVLVKSYSRDQRNRPVTSFTDHERLSVSLLKGKYACDGIKKHSQTAFSSLWKCLAQPKWPQKNYISVYHAELVTLWKSSLSFSHLTGKVLSGQTDPY